MGALALRTPEHPNVKNLKWWVRPVCHWTIWTAAIWNTWHWRH